jgi:uncharacterized membrane protein
MSLKQQFAEVVEDETELTAAAAAAIDCLFTILHQIAVAATAASHCLCRFRAAAAAAAAVQIGISIGVAEKMAL